MATMKKTKGLNNHLHYTDNWRLSNINPNKKRGWIDVPRKDKQMLIQCIKISYIKKQKNTHTHTWSLKFKHAFRLILNHQLSVHDGSAYYISWFFRYAFTSVLYNNKIRWFQYITVRRIKGTNEPLFKIKQKPASLCTFCWENSATHSFGKI